MPQVVLLRVNRGMWRLWLCVSVLCVCAPMCCHKSPSGLPSGVVSCAPVSMSRILKSRACTHANWIGMCVKCTVFVFVCCIRKLNHLEDTFKPNITIHRRRKDTHTNTSECMFTNVCSCVDVCVCDHDQWSPCTLHFAIDRYNDSNQII